MDASLIDEAVETIRASLHKQFNRGQPKEWVLRASNVGRPLCQLWHERAGTPGEPIDHTSVMRMVIGDLLEPVVVAVLKSAGVPVQGTSEKITVEIDA